MDMMNEPQGGEAFEDAAFKAAVETTAYLLWEAEGCPEGRQEEHYLRALDMHRQQAAEAAVADETIASAVTAD